MCASSAAAAAAWPPPPLSPLSLLQHRAARSPLPSLSSCPCVWCGCLPLVVVVCCMQCMHGPPPSVTPLGSSAASLLASPHVSSPRLLPSLSSLLLLSLPPSFLPPHFLPHPHSLPSPPPSLLTPSPTSPAPSLPLAFCPSPQLSSRPLFPAQSLSTIGVFQHHPFTETNMRNAVDALRGGWHRLQHLAGLA